MFARRREGDVVDRVHVDTNRWSQSLPQFSVESGAAAVVPSWSENEPDFDTLGPLLSDLKALHGREVLDEVREELARNAPTIRCIDHIELATDHLAQQRKPSSA